MKHFLMGALPGVLLTLAILAGINRLSPTNPIRSAING